MDKRLTNVMGDKTINQIKDSIASIVVDHCDTSSFETVISIAEDVMAGLDKILFSDDFEGITEEEINAELATLITTNIQRRGLAITDINPR